MNSLEVQSKNDKIKFHISESTNQQLNCKLCGKSYTSYTGVTLHIKSFHYGIKEYSCKSCEKSFTQSPSLKDHIRNKHEGLNGKKAYECEFCEKGFSQNHSLKSHINNVHEELKSKNDKISKNVHKGLKSKNDKKSKKRCICNLCGKSCNKIELHLERVHGRINTENTS